MLSDDLESLINDLGKAGLNESTIKGRLSLFQDQAKAQEADIAKKETDIKYAEIRITKLETQLHEYEQTEQKDVLKQQSGRLEDVAEKILWFLFEWEEASHRPDRSTVVIDHIVSKLGVRKGVVQHFSDALSGLGFMRVGMFGEYYLDEEGRAYVVKHLLG